MGCFHGIARLVLIHILGALGMNNTLTIRHNDVLSLQPQLNQQIKAGERCGACTGGDQFDLTNLLADHPQPIDHSGADHDGSTVLIIMKHRNLHPLFQCLLDDEALRRLDIFQVDAAEGGLQTGDGLDELLWVTLFHLNIKDIDIGKLLEENRLPLHHRLGGKAANRTQPQHGSTVTDHRHQIGARRILCCI